MADIHCPYCDRDFEIPELCIKPKLPIDDKVKAQAWDELCKCFGERMQQDELDLMDSVLNGVKLEMEDDMERFSIAEVLKRFPHSTRD